MNEIRRVESEADEIARVRAVMDRFPLPDFVVGYTVEFGVSDEEPALWIRFQTTFEPPETQEAGLAVGKKASQLSLDAYDFLRDAYPERRPYFRFLGADQQSRPQG